MRSLLLALFLVPVACTKAAPPGPSPSESSKPVDELAHLKKMSVDDVEKRIADKDPSFFVFDANMREVFDKGHVPGATFVPDEGVTASLLPKDKAATLLFYCSNEH
jgi:hypothetical protein